MGVSRSGLPEQRAKTPNEGNPRPRPPERERACPPKAGAPKRWGEAPGGCAVVIAPDFE